MELYIYTHRYVPISIYLSVEVTCDPTATKAGEKLTLWQTSDLISLRARSENTQPQFLKKQNLQRKDKTYNRFQETLCLKDLRAVRI